MMPWPRRSSSTMGGAPMHSTCVGVATSLISEGRPNAPMGWRESSPHRRIEFAKHARRNRRRFVNTRSSTDRFTFGSVDIVATPPTLSVMATFTFAIDVTKEIRNARDTDAKELENCRFWRASRAQGRVVHFPNRMDATNTPMDRVLNANKFIIALRVSHVPLVILLKRILARETL